MISHKFISEHACSLHKSIKWYKGLCFSFFQAVIAAYSIVDGILRSNITYAVIRDLF